MPRSLPIPFSQPTPRGDISEKAFDVFDEFVFDPEQDEHRPIIRSMLARVFEEAKLPPVLEKKLNLSNRVRDPIRRAKNDLLEQDIPEETLDALRAEICTAINLLFYDEYINTTVTQKLIPYCKTHEPPKSPKSWGFGSIFYWDEAWGRGFYSFWRHAIEKADYPYFKTRVLPELPVGWQESYKIEKPFVFCPYKWGAMSDEEIAEVLVGLKKTKDPATEGWWLGSIAYWSGANSNEAWGKSFWSWWRNPKNGEQEGDEQFQARFMKFFPPEWKKNFSKLRTDAIDWLKMPNNEMAKLLNGLTRPHGLKKWGLGSVWRWFDSSSGRSYGVGFAQYWRRSVESEGDTEFRHRILPLLKSDLRDLYRPVGYEISFGVTTQKSRLQAEETNDMNELHALADKGNRVAFDRLKKALHLYLQRATPRCQYPEVVLDRIIHMHMAIFGKIEKYAVISVRRFQRRFAFAAHMEHSPHMLRDRAAAEDQAIEKIDVASQTRPVILFLVKAGVSKATMRILFDMLIDDVPLRALMEDPNAKLAYAAQVMDEYIRDRG